MQESKYKISFQTLLLPWQNKTTTIKAKLYYQVVTLTCILYMASTAIALALINDYLCFLVQLLTFLSIICLLYQKLQQYKH